jgi:hypothetical protein
VEDREAINKGVKTKGYIFGYTTNSNAISPSPPASVDQYFIDENNRFCIYLKCVRQDPPSGCRPGRILKFRNSTNFEDRLIYISSLFEKPHQWWKTEPGYQALLHSMNIKSFVQHETDVVEKPSCMVLVLIFYRLQ